MKLSTFLILIGCAIAIATVKATDHYFGPTPDATWKCITDTECETEERAHEHGERCFRFEQRFVCLPIDRR